MGLFARHNIIFLTVIVACGYANAGAIVKRANDDGQPSGGLSGVVTTLNNFLKAVPLIGDLMSRSLEWVVRAVGLFEIGTNGALARLLGGALPCTVSLSGTECTGLRSNGGFGKILIDVINDIPGFAPPKFISDIMALFIQLFISPTIDVIFGGVAVDP